MPVYNGERYIKEAIESILNQTFTNFELIIVNDGSTDHTEEIILSYDDERIRYFKNDVNLQIVKTLNKGLRLARCKYIARMDADDVSYAERLQIQYAFMQKNPEIAVCGTALSIYEQPDIVYVPPLVDGAIKAKLIFENCLYHPTILFRKEAILAQGGYDSLYSNAEDYELWQRLSRIENINFANLPAPLLRYRKHYDIDRSEYDINQKRLTKLIIKKQLKYLGVNFNNEMFLYHEILASPENYTINIKSLHKCGECLDKIEKANAISHAFSSIYLNNELENRWFIICLISAECHPLAAFNFIKRKWTHISRNKLYLFIKIIWKSRLCWFKYIFK